MRSLSDRSTGELPAGNAPMSRSREHESGWKATITLPGASPAHDFYRPFEALPAELIGAELLQSAHAERHATVLATGRVWKTHVVATKNPDQIAVTFGADPTRELVWTWRTSPKVTSTVLRLARTAGTGSTEKGDIRLVRGHSACIEVANLLNDPVIRRHRVVADGLEADTVYDYSVGDGSPDGWGPWQRIKTAPDRLRGVRLLYLGDAQTGLERWGRLLATASRRHPETDFVLLAGDLVDRGNERTNWDHFFLRAARVFERLPVVPCVGNHEYLDMGPRLYRAFFSLPPNGPAGVEPGLVYHFECGDTCFAVLDSTLAVSDPDQAKRQAKWLDGVLARSRATWKIVAFHHPVYPSHPWRDTPVLREQWVPVFDKHHVDLVLQGHDHAYLRTYPMRGGHQAAAGSKGTVYVIAVSGDKFVEQAPRDYIAVGRAGVATYQTIATDPRTNELHYRAWSEDGTIVDEFRITRSGPKDHHGGQAVATHFASWFGPKIPGASGTIEATPRRAASALRRHEGVGPAPVEHPAEGEPGSPVRAGGFWILDLGFWIAETGCGARVAVFLRVLTCTPGALQCGSPQSIRSACAATRSGGCATTSAWRRDRHGRHSGPTCKDDRPVGRLSDGRAGTGRGGARPVNAATTRAIVAAGSCR